MNVKEKLISILPFIFVSMFILGVVFAVLFIKSNNDFMYYLSFCIMFLGVELATIYDVHNLANNMHSPDIKKQLDARAEAEEWSKIWATISMLGFFINLWCLFSCNIAVYIEQLIADLLFVIVFFTAIAVAFYSVSIIPEPEKPKYPEKVMNAAS